MFIRKLLIALWVVLPASTTAVEGVTAGASEPVGVSSSSSDSVWRLRLGAGYPDLRLRGQAWGPLDAELKLAYDAGVFSYSARLYGAIWSRSGFHAYLGGEAGLASFSGVEGLVGSATFGSAFAGAEWRFTERWALNLDLGPAMVNVNSSGLDRSGTEWVVNTALYWRVF